MTIFLLGECCSVLRCCCKLMLFFLLSRLFLVYFSAVFWDPRRVLKVFCCLIVKWVFFYAALLFPGPSLPIHSGFFFIFSLNLTLTWYTTFLGWQCLFRGHSCFILQLQVDFGVCGVSDFRIGLLLLLVLCFQYCNWIFYFVCLMWGNVCLLVL